MLRSHSIQSCCGVCLLLGLIAFGPTVQAQAPEPIGPTPADFKRLAEVFAPPGTPGIKGKSWVAVDTGPADWTTELHGWLIEDGPQLTESAEGIAA